MWVFAAIFSGQASPRRTLQLSTEKENTRNYLAMFFAEQPPGFRAKFLLGDNAGYGYIEKREFGNRKDDRKMMKSKHPHPRFLQERRMTPTVQYI